MSRPPENPPPDNDYDWSFAERNAGGNKDLVNEIIDLALASTPEAVAEISLAAAAGDADALLEAAHRLKGALMMFGPNGAASAAQTLEAMARARTLDEVSVKIDELEAEWPILKRHMETYRGGS